MSACTFFGHRDCPEAVKPHLREVLIGLIEQQGVDRFYVGRNGAFDRMAYAVLRELSQRYPQISCAVVLERLPDRQESDTLLPEGIECVPPRFAIAWRNRWMLRQADYVVTYVRYPGNAAQYAALAQRQGKTVIPLA